MKILCSRLPCGCMASALLADYDIPQEVKRFIREEKEKGRLTAWEERDSVWAERCMKHEWEYLERVKKC